MIPFGPWLPDLPALQNPGATVATNVIPAPASYRPFPDLVALSAALPARCQGAFAARSSAGTVFTFAGTATALYRLSGTAWADVSRTAGGAYGCPADAFWSFAQYGDFVIAVNGADAAQGFNMASSTNFAALAGSPPVAKYVAVVREQVVMANLSGQTQRVQFSAIDNSADWAVSAITQADFNDLLGDHGDIMGLVGGDYGVVFMERGIFRMDYVGAPLIYQFTRVEQARGLAAPRGLAPLGAQVFYLTDDGFYLFDGAQSTPIGKNRVDKTFWADVDQSLTYRICAAVDPINALVLWAYAGAGNIGGNPNHLMLYNWTSDRWSRVELNTEFLWRDLSKGYTLEGLDAISTSLDALPFSLDSRAYAGGKILLSAFDSTHKLAYFTGANLAATVETTEANVVPGQRAMVTALRPIVDGGTVTVQVAARERQVDAASYGASASLGADGRCPVRSSGRYHRARLALVAGGSWSHAQGVEVEAVPDGAR